METERPDRKTKRINVMKRTGWLRCVALQVVCVLMWAGRWRTKMKQGAQSESVSARCMRYPACRNRRTFRKGMLERPPSTETSRIKNREGRMCLVGVLGVVLMRATRECETQVRASRTVRWTFAETGCAFANWDTTSGTQRLAPTVGRDGGVDRWLPVSWTRAATGRFAVGADKNIWLLRQTTASIALRVG